MENEQKKPSGKDRIGYGVKVPPLSFSEAIRAIKDLANLAGESGSLDALAKILDHSRSSSNFTFKVAALRNFGLLTSDKLNYYLTDIAKRIVSPESIADELRAIQESFSKQELLDRIWGNFKGKILPQREYLANYIEKALGIPPLLKQPWADYFKQAAEYAGILNERESGSYHVLYEPLIPKAEKTDENRPPEGQGPIVVNPPGEVRQLPPSETIENTHWGSLTQRKLSGDRKAIFAIPDELTQEDIDVLKAILKGIDAGLDGLKKFDS